jgi:adenosine deaminase
MNTIIVIYCIIVLCIGIGCYMYYTRNTVVLSEKMNTFLEGMPKTALHMHLEGSLEPEMAYANAVKYNMLPLEVPNASGGTTTVNTLDELKKVYQFDDLISFLNIYNLLATTLKEKKDFTALASAYCDKALSENIQHAEIFFDPQTHTARGLDFDDVVDGIQEGLEKGRVKGLSIQLICSFLRDHTVGSEEKEDTDSTDPSAWHTVKQAVKYNQNNTTTKPSFVIVGMGLDNNEVGYPPELFKEVFEYGRLNGMFGVAHGGEEGPPEYIWECIKQLECIRIDHGVRTIEDSLLTAYMSTPQNTNEIINHFGSSHLIPITVCPLSNYKLDVFTDPEMTNIVEMLDLGIMVTVNSDDPAYFGGYVTDNYKFLMTSLDNKVAKGRAIDLSDIRRIVINGFYASVIPLEKKLAYIETVNSYFLVTPGDLYTDFVSNY